MMAAVRQIEFTQIADNWDSITLGEESPQALLAMRNGLTAQQTPDGGKYKISRIETIGAGWIDDQRVRFASGLQERDIEKYRIREGDILFSHINSDPHLGKTGIAKCDYSDLLHGMNLLLIRANPEVFDAQFLNRVFQYYRDIGVFVSICSRAVNQSSINQAKMKALEVPLPPLPEQKKIAYVLSTVQRAIEQQERIIQTTTELKKALMHKLFTEGLRGEPQKMTEIGPVPESWEVKFLGEIANLQSGGTPSRKKIEYWKNGNVPWVKTAEINYSIVYDTEEHITEVGLRNSSAKIFPKGTLLIAMYGQGITRGRVGILGIDSASNQACAAIGPRDEQELLIGFLYYFLEYHYENLRRRGHGANQSNLSMTLLKLFEVAYPNLEQQKNICQTLTTIDEKLQLHQKKKASFNDLFRTLLHELMTAKIRVHKLELLGGTTAI